MQRTLKSFKYATRGLISTWKEEVNFRIEVLVSIVVVFCIYYFDFTFIESVLCVIAITLVLVLEIINTIIEDLCNKIEPNQDKTIEKIKDMAAAFVFLGGIGALVIGIFVSVNHFTSLL